jgi:Ca-activated chloride channel family protein
MVPTLSLLALLASTSSAAHPPIFSGGVQLVDVAVTVSRQGELVAGLQPDQFIVLEDGAPQPIVRFAHQDMPLAVTLLLDVSRSMTPYADAVQQAASRFIAALGPRDVAQVVTFSQRMHVVQGFTSDHDVLMAAVKARDSGDQTALQNALYVLMREQQQSAPDTEPRRKAILLFSDGEDNSSLISDEQLVDTARRSGVGLYSIFFSPTNESQPSRPERESARYLLSTLAEATGGAVYPVDSALGLPKAFVRVADELHEQYNLGFAPSRATSKAWHSILVFVRNSNLVVRHRAGFYDGDAR